MPPSNLLDKIARGVAKAKGPVNWPHSLRATRAKIVELARARAKDILNDGASDTIAEEEGSDIDESQPTARFASKRPLYRQSSMDFMKAEARNWADNDNISRYVSCMCASGRCTYRVHQSLSATSECRPHYINPIVQIICNLFVSLDIPLPHPKRTCFLSIDPKLYHAQFQPV